MVASYPGGQRAELALLHAGFCAWLLKYFKALYSTLPLQLLLFVLVAFQIFSFFSLMFSQTKTNTSLA